jgi:hypothetical protein
MADDTGELAGQWGHQSTPGYLLTAWEKKNMRHLLFGLLIFASLWPVVAHASASIAFVHMNVVPMDH